MATVENSAPSWEQFSSEMAQNGLTDAQMGEAKGQYFEKYVAPHFDPKEIPSAWKEFSAQAKLPESSSFSSEVGKGFMRGLNTLGQGVVGSTATAMESVERNRPGTIAPENMSRIREMERQQTRDRRPYESGYSDFDNVHGVKDFGKFIAANTGEGVATSLPVFTGLGLAGAGVGAGVTELGNIHKQAADRAEAQSYLNGTDPNKYYENIDTGKLALGTGVSTAGELVGEALGPFRKFVAPTGSALAKPFDLLDKTVKNAAGRIAAKTGVTLATEGGTEFGQTFAEEYGAGNPNWHSPEVVGEARKAGLSAMGGALVPGVGSAVYDHYRKDQFPPATEQPPASGPQEPGMGALPPPEQKPETEQEANDRQFNEKADILSRVQSIIPNAFEPGKKGEGVEKPLDYKDFKKRADQAWKDTVPAPSEEDVMPSFLEAAKADPNLSFDKFYKESVKKAQEEHAKANPRPTDAELVHAFKIYRDMHSFGIRSFDDAMSALRQSHYPDEQRTEKDVTPPLKQIEGPEKQNALPAPLGQQYRDAADAIDRGDYGPPSAESSALLRNIADRHEEAVQKLNQQNQPEVQKQGAPFTPAKSEAEVLQQLYGLPGRGQTDMFGFPPSDPNRQESSVQEEEPSGPTRGVQRQINFEEPALPAPVAYKLRQEADAIERGDYGPGHPLAVQALRSAADRYDAETRASQDKAEADVLKAEAKNTPPDLPAVPTDRRREEVRRLGMPQGIPPTSKPKKTVTDFINESMAEVAGDNKGKQSVIRGMKKSLETLVAPDVNPLEVLTAMREANESAKLKPENQKLREDFINTLERKITDAKNSAEQSLADAAERESKRSKVRGKAEGQSEADNAAEGQEVADATRPTGENAADVSGSVGEVQTAKTRKRGTTRVSRLNRGGASNAGADRNAGEAGSEGGTVSNDSEHRSSLKEAQQKAISEIEDKYDALITKAHEKFFDGETPEEIEAGRAEIHRYQAEKREALKKLEGINPLISFSRSENGKPASILSPDFVKSTAERFASGRLGGIEVEVVPDESALPKEVLDQAEKEGALGEIGAVHWDGRVILVANRMKSKADIKEAILHEGTHLGRMKLFQAQARKAYIKLWNRLGGRSGMEAWAKKLNIEMSKYWKTADDLLKKDGDANEHRFYLVDEFLAQMQGRIAHEKGFDSLKRWFQEFLGAARHFAKQLGYKTESITEADLHYLLKNLRNAASHKKLSASLAEPARFSRTPKEVADEVSERVVDYIKDTYQDKIPTAAKLLLNPHQLATLYPKFPALRKIAHLLDSMQAETVRKQQAFASIVEDIAALPSVVRGQLLDVMTSATLYDLHPDVAFRDQEGKNAHLMGQADKEVLHSKVSAQYRALPKEAKALYARARDEFITSWNERFEAVRSLAKRLDLPDREREKISQELDRVSAKIKGPYFPLFREGNWTVVWKSPAIVKAEEAGDTKLIDALKGNPSDFFYFRTDSKQLAKRVAETVPNGMAAGSSSEGPYRHVKNDGSAQGVTTEFMQKVEAAISARLGKDRKDEADEAVSALRSVFVNAMPDMSVMKRTLARRGVAGVSSDDMLKAIARAGSADAFYLSRIKFADRLTRLLQALRQEDINPRRGETVDPRMPGKPKGGDGGVYQAMLVNYRANMQPPDESLTTSIANKITSLHYFKTLVLSPAFMVTNMMQPWMVSAPVMSPRFSDKSVSKALGQATLEAFNLAKPKSLALEDLSKYELDLSKIKDEGERKMLEVLKDRGRIEISQARDLAALAKTDAYWLNKAMRVGASFSHVTETVNRLASALASYRLEKDRLSKDPHIQGAEVERRATEYADEIVRDTQVDYSPAGMPTFMKMGRQGLRRLMFQYKRYLQAMAFLYWKIGKEAFAGDKQALKAFGGLSLTHFLAAGMGGMAVYPLLQAIGAIGADDDETSEEWLDAMTLEMAGGDKDLARAIRLGLPTYMGVDLSKKLGQGDLATLGIRTNPRGDTTPEKITNFLVDLFPSLDVLTSVGKAWDTFQQSGDATKAFGAFGFKPFSDVAKTADVSERGLTNKAGTVQYLKPEQYDWADKMWKSLGFTPVIESEHYRAVEAKTHKEEFYKDLRTKLLDDYARAKVSGTPAQASAAETAMKEFSSKVPENMKEFKIRAQDWIKHLNSIKRQGKRVDETGVTLPKKGGKWIEETVSPYEVTQ